MSITDRNKKYSSYSAEDFLQDDYFINSIIKPTRESEIFWEKAVKEKTIHIDDYKAARYFIDSVQIKTAQISNEEIFTLWEDIEIRNKQNLQRKRKRLYIFISSVAGIVAVFISLFSLKNTFYKVPKKIPLSYNIEDVKTPETQTNGIQLILAQNEKVSLEGDDAEIIYHDGEIAINNSDTYLKKKQKAIANEIIYNQLIVPKGKRSLLTFAEGTKLWVNAGTRVVYPSAFSADKREIFIDGEAYLEVSHNQNSPFIVKTKELEVEVLGTSFNIMAYEKDTIRQIVLVSGSVKINMDKGENRVLAPTEMFTLEQGKVDVKSVDTEEYTSWRHGLYQYKSEKLGIILKRLSNYYGKEIECNRIASTFKCTGKLDLKDDLFLVISGISKTVPIECDTIDGKYIITNK